jgi:hypothetical protein
MEKGHKNARLDFIQNLDYKFIELLSCVFDESEEQTRRDSITYRYTSAKTKLQLMEARLRDVNNLIKLKNPSLLLNLQKS